jgi:hypothetical protein
MGTRPSPPKRTRRDGTDVWETKTIVLTVLSTFESAWLEKTASPQEVTDLLQFATNLPRSRGVADVEAICAAFANEALSSKAKDVSRLEEQIHNLTVQLTDQRSATVRAQEDLSRCMDRRDEQTELQVLRQVQEASARSSEEIEALRKTVTMLSGEKTEMQHSHTEQARTQLNEIVALTKENAALSKDLEMMRTPASRGRSGELVVADALGENGFEVKDTSMGACKEEGFMDLLVSPHGVPDLRIAIECKNRQKIDPNTDVATFLTKAKDGVRKGMFESAIFVSLRAHTKRPQAHTVEMVAIEPDGAPHVPVSYVGPERGAESAALAREALIAHVAMHTALTMECQRLKRSLVQTSQELAEGEDAETSARQLESLTSEFTRRLCEESHAILDDMASMSKTVGTLQTSIKSVRLRMVRTFLAAVDARRQGLVLARQAVPFLTAWKDPAWVSDFESIKGRTVIGQSEAVSWKNTSEQQRRRLTQALGNRETVYAAVRSANKESRRDVSVTDGADSEGSD